MDPKLGHKIEVSFNEETKLYFRTRSQIFLSIQEDVTLFLQRLAATSRTYKKKIIDVPHQIRIYKVITSQRDALFPGHRFTASVYIKEQPAAQFLLIICENQQGNGWIFETAWLRVGDKSYRSLER